MQVRIAAIVVALTLALALPLAPRAGAQDRAGDFDHYLLALSWIPAYCAEDGDARDDPRCRAGTATGWAVHGLWPQHADGSWPQYCSGPQRDPSRRDTARQAALFGTSGAAWHQWNKHGRCTGLSAADYYALTALAVARVTLPDVFDRVEQRLRVAPDVVEAAFIEANPDLTPAMMVTSCPDGTLVELRLCLTRDLSPRPCAARTEARSCRLPGATLLPLR